MNIPGVGPTYASAIQAFAQPIEHPCLPSSGFWGFFRRLQKCFPFVLPKISIDRWRRSHGADHLSGRRADGPGNVSRPEGKVGANGH